MGRPVKDPNRVLRRPETSQRRSEIVAVASEVFAARGYANATTRDVAEAVGILAGSLYHHFRSKDEILEEVLRQFWDDLIRDYRNAAESHDDPIEALEALVRLGLTYAIDRRAECTILANDYPYLRRVPAFAFNEARSAEVEGIWVSVLERGTTQGALRRDLDPVIVSRSIRNSLLGTVRWFVPSGPINLEDLIRVQASLFLAGMDRTHERADQLARQRKHARGAASRRGLSEKMIGSIGL